MAPHVPIDYPHTDVEVLVRARRRGVPQHPMLFVLKSQYPVTWHMKTAHGVRGRMEIVTDDHDAIDRTGVQLQAFQITVDSLPYTGDQLISKVHSHYGNPVSYTQVTGATKFEVLVGPEDHLPRSPFDHPGRTQDMLRNSRVITCYNNSVTVTYSRNDLQHHGVGRFHLSLADPLCRAKQNSTHVILTTDFTGCATTHNSQLGHYVNKIIVHEDQQADSSQDEKEEFSSGSGMNVDDTMSDDEDFNRPSHYSGREIVAEFTCKLPLMRVGPSDHVESRPQFELHLFRDSDFEQELIFPYRVGGSGSLYVETRIIADPRLEAVVKSCWVSPFKNHPQGHVLITKGCDHDKTVEWLEPSADKASQRFKFHFSRFWGKDYVVYVFCNISVCSADREYGKNRVPECMSRDKYCIMRSMDQTENWQHLEMAPTGQTKAGPIRMMHHNPPPPPPPPITPHTPQSIDEPLGTTCINEIKGLDSGTVVGIAFAAFIIGVLLTAALWFIHSHTGPGRHGPLSRRSNRPRSAETSGESTPSSTAPITIHQVHHH